MSCFCEIDKNFIILKIEVIFVSRIIKMQLLIYMLILLFGCINHSEYYSREDVLYGWGNNQFAIKAGGSLDYRYREGETVKADGIANYILVYREIAGQLYVISDELYCVIDKNNICKIYVYDKPLMDYYKNSYSYTQEQYCYTTNMDIIHNNNFRRLNNFNEFSAEEQKNIIDLKNEALSNNILYKNDCITIMNTYSGCVMYYTYNDYHKINIMNMVSDFKETDNKLYVAGLLYNKSDVDSADYAVVAENNIKLYNIFLRSRGDNEPFYYSAENIIELHSLSDFTQEEQSVLMSLKNNDSIKIQIFP